MLRVLPTARIGVFGQAPGTRVHASGVPFSDPSGDRLREWMGLGPDAFYDTRRVAILPMGFCFPGLDGKGSDLPPRPECAPHWRERLLAHLPQLSLVLLIGGHAQRWHLGAEWRGSVSATVEDWRALMAAPLTRQPIGATALPLPHPSWRNNAWLKARPWFASELLPVLRARISAELAGT